jgi:hypothetical protein
MNSASRSAYPPAEHQRPIDQQITRYRMPIVVRLKYGEELTGMNVHRDGLSFQSPSPIPAGRIVELILCGGSILVDAEIKDCAPAPQGGGFLISAEFHHTSNEMRQLIAEEMSRHQQED